MLDDYRANAHKLLDICNLPLLSSDAKKVSSKPQLLQLLPKVDKRK